MDFTEKTLSVQEIYDGRVFSVHKDTIRLPNGKQATRETIDHNGGAAVIALTDDNEIFLVTQYRYGVHETLIEIPAGKLEKGEDPMDCAKRELDEEIGFKAGKIIPFGVYIPTPAYCGEKNYIYLATDLQPGEQHLDEDEFLKVEKVPFAKAYDMVMSGEIKDMKTVIAILRLKNYANL